MKVVLFGGTGMIGKGVLLEALDSPDITQVLSVGRRTVDVEHPKLQQVIHADFENFDALTQEFGGVEACFWCLGISSTGLDEAAYTRITYDFTMAAARVLHRESPNLRFCFVSGMGTDETEKGRLMWARVKGKAENDLQKIGFREVIIFRPAFILPMRGVQAQDPKTRVFYRFFRPLASVFRWFGNATTTVEMGQAMIAAAKGHATKHLLNSADMNALAAKAKA